MQSDQPLQVKVPAEELTLWWVVGCKAIQYMGMLDQSLDLDQVIHAGVWQGVVADCSRLAKR